jgi:hypothetical protein
MIATEEDTGPFVHALLKVSPGKNLIGVRKWMKMGEFVEVFGKVFNVKTRMLQPSGDPFESFPAPLREEFHDMVGYLVECGYDSGKLDGSVVQPGEVSQLTPDFHVVRGMVLMEGVL